MWLLCLALLAHALPVTAQAPLVSLTIRWNYTSPAPPTLPLQTGFSIQGCQTTWTNGCVMQDLLNKPVGPRQLQVQLALPASINWLCVQVIALAPSGNSPPSDRVCRVLSIS